MKKIRPFILMMLLVAMAVSVTACGSTDNNATQSTTGSNTQAATQQSGTAAMDNSAAESTGGGIIDGVVNDIEKGADDVRNGVDNMTGETTGNGSSTTTESGATR